MVVGHPTAMKLLLAAFALLCLVHINATTHVKIFTPGYEYRYKYLAQSLTSMPDDPLTAAIAHKGSIVVVAEKDYVYVKIERMQSAMLNTELKTVDMEKIPYEFTEMGPSTEKLYSPMKIIYDRGLIKEFESDGSESTEITNLKKAILTLLQLKIEHPKQMDAQSSKNDDDFNTYDIVEDGIAGLCVSQYVVESNPWAGNPQASVLNVTKMRDFENCQEEVEMVFSSHAPYNCSDCDADDFDPIDTMRVLEYDISNPEGMFAIEAIESRATTIFIPFTSNGDEFMTNHSQKMVLKEMKPISGRIPSPVSPKRHHDLRYRFPSVYEIDPKPEDLHRRPQQILPLDGKKYPSEVRRLLEEVTKEIMSSQREPMLHTPLKAQQLARALRTLAESDITQIYEETNSRASTEEGIIRKRLLVDTLLMCGSLPSLHFLVKLVEARQFQDYRASEILTALPFYIRRPTASFIESVLKVCESTPNKGGFLHSSCWLAFGSLVDQSCGSYETTLPTSPGVETYCTPEMERRYTQAVWRQLQSSSRKDLRLIYLRTLRIMGLKDVIEVVKPYANGDLQVSEMVRVQAILALMDIDDDDDTVQSEISDIVGPIFLNKDESSIVRSVALFAVMSSNPLPHYLERIASVTWDDDEDDQLVNLIYSVLDNKANTSYPCYKEDARHALNALGFAQDQDIGIQDSQFNIMDYYDEDYMMGSLFEYLAFANNNSFIPRAMRVNFERTIAGFTQSPFEGAVYLEGLESVLKRIVGPMSAFEKLSLKDIFASTYEKPPKNFHDLFSKLNIDPRDDEPLSVLIHAKFLSTQYKMLYIDYDTVLRAIQSGFDGYKDLIANGLKVNYQKTMNFGYVKYQIPSSIGYPIFLQIKSPAIIDLKGKLTVDAPKLSDIITHPSTPKVVTIKSTIRPTISLNLMTTLGVADPFKKIYATVGVTSESYLSLPNELSVELNLDDAKIVVGLKPASHVMASPEVTIMRHTIKPFTALYPYDKFVLIEKFSKPILTDDTPDVYEYRIGEELLGVPAKFIVKSDLFWQDQGSFLQYFIHDNTPLSLATLWFATPDFNYREYLLKMNSQAAANTELQFTVDLDYIPSQIQSALLQGQTGIKGILNYYLGWSKFPWQCDLLDHTYPNFPDTDSSLGIKPKYRSQKFDSDYDDTSFKSKFDYDDDVVDDVTMRYSRKSSRRSMDSSYFDDDTDDDYSEYRLQKKPTKYVDDDDVYTRSSKYSQREQKSSKLRHKRDIINEPAIIKKIPFTAENAENVYKLKVEAAVRGNVQRALKSQFTWTRNIVQLADHLALQVNIENPPYTPDSELKICAKGHMKYPKLPCDYANALKPEHVSNIVTNFELSYGQQCGNKKFAIQSEFSKTEDQIESERKRDDWIFKQCKSDYEEGKKLSDACEKAIIAIGDLKKAVHSFQFQLDDLPYWFVNVSSKVQNFLIYYFYSQMSDNYVDVHNPEGKVKIVAEFDNDSPTLDIKILKPRENLFFDNIYYPEISEMIRPINARISRSRLNLDDITEGYVPPTCTVMGDFVQNFDNTTYKMPLTKCKHVITKDCSPSDLFSVLMSKTDNEKLKELQVYLLRHNIVVRATAPYSGQYQVIIDGKQTTLTSTDPILMLSHNHPESKDIVFTSIFVMGPFLEIRAAYHGLWIKFDGINAKISLSNVWRGDVCGLCSEFDGYTDRTFIGPGQCEFADPKDFLMSYFVPSTHCTPPPPSDRKICPDDIPTSSITPPYNDDDDDDDDDDDVTTPFYPDPYTTPYYPDDDDDDDDDTSGATFPKTTKPLLRNKYIQRGREECFSIKPVPECIPGYYDVATKMITIEFACFDKVTDSQKIRQLKQFRGQKPLRELSGEIVDYTQTVSIPTSCQRN